MKQIKQYSNLVSCIHDEPEPVGHLGRGTHHSVFRCVQWRDSTVVLPNPLVQEFCVVWDEDHDERIIPVIERIYMEDLLSPILFIGERKGGLTAILREECVTPEALDDYFLLLERICDSFDDPWGCSIGTFAGSRKPSIDACQSLVNDESVKVQAYLAGIDAVWSLGLKPFSPSASV